MTGVRTRSAGSKNAPRPARAGVVHASHHSVPPAACFDRLRARCAVPLAPRRGVDARARHRRRACHRPRRAHVRAGRAAADAAPRGRRTSSSTSRSRRSSLPIAGDTTYTFWTFGGQRARAVHPRAPGRHRRAAPEERARQQDAAQHRPPRRHRTRRRRAAHVHRAGPPDGVHVQGASRRASTSTTARRRRSACTSRTACTA